MTHDPIYSTSDLSRKSGDIIAEALRRPVTITQRNKPRLVLLSIEDYRRLTARADTRRAGRLETMPDGLFEEVKEAVSAYERKRDAWLTAAAKRTHRTADTASLVIDAVERAEMDGEHAALDELLK